MMRDGFIRSTIFSGSVLAPLVVNECAYAKVPSVKPKDGISFHPRTGGRTIHLLRRTQLASRRLRYSPRWSNSPMEVLRVTRSQEIRIPH
jgi:hypothetical protein